MRVLFAVCFCFIAMQMMLQSCTEISFPVRDDTLKCPTSSTDHIGEATYYWNANGGGSCSYDHSGGDLMVGAMNAFDFEDSRYCGASVQITGPEGTIIVRIVDLCPECPTGNIDLSPAAFQLIADTALGRIPIRWKLVPSPVQGPIEYHFKDSINHWWTAVQIRNQRYPIHSIEYRTADHTFNFLERMPYNYFAGYAGMGDTPFTFRVTDIYGHTLIDSGIVPVFGKDIPGSGQFPLCQIHE